MLCYAYLAVGRQHQNMKLTNAAALTYENGLRAIAGDNSFDVADSDMSLDPDNPVLKALEAAADETQRAVQKQSRDLGERNQAREEERSARVQRKQQKSNGIKH